MASNFTLHAWAEQVSGRSYKNVRRHRSWLSVEGEIMVDRHSRKLDSFRIVPVPGFFYSVQEKTNFEIAADGISITYQWREVVEGSLHFCVDYLNAVLTRRG